jgi:hypothetical protein
LNRQIVLEHGLRCMERTDDDINGIHHGHGRAQGSVEGDLDGRQRIYGAMFAPRPDLVASRAAARVPPRRNDCHGQLDGGGIHRSDVQDNRTLHRTLGHASPVLWGDENVARERLGPGVSDLRLTRVSYRFDYPFPPAGVVEFFREYYGPTTRAFAALGKADAAALRSDLAQLWTSRNQTSEPGRTIVDAEYLQVVGVRA